MLHFRACRTAVAGSPAVFRYMMIIFEPVFKWEVVRSAIQACLEHEIPFSMCQRNKFRCTYEHKVWQCATSKIGRVRSPSGLLVDSFALHCNEAIDTSWNSC